MRALGASRTSLVPGGVLAGPWVRDPLWRRARAVPSLDLRFANNKSLIDAVTGASLVTFTRASSGTFVDSAGVIQTAATDVPRFDHNPTTGESLGLLVEEARTNIKTGSQDFSNTYWPSSAAIRTNNNAVAPDGTTTACLAAGSGANFGGLVRSLAVVYAASTTYTFSCFAKAGTHDFIGLRITANCVTASDIYCAFNLTTGAATPITPLAGTVVSVSTVSYPNGWYRCNLVYTTSASQVGTKDICDVALVASSGNHNYTGTGNVLIWGAQLEAGAFPTSYIPTTAAAVTRSADVCSITGSAFSSWYRQSEGTVFAELAVAQPASGGNQFAFRSSDNTFNNSIGLLVESSGFASLATATGGVFDGNAGSALALSANTAAKFVGAYAANNLGLSLNGATAVTDATATIPIAQTRADIGSNHVGAARIKAGTIKRIAFWPTRLANTTLQQITQ